MSNQTTSVDVAHARLRHAHDPGTDRVGGTAHGVVDLHRQLLETAFDLSVEYDTLPAGSVLRCFARAVRMARMKGAEGAGLPEEARRIAESSLRGRAASGSRRVRGTRVLPATA
jgi:hypothetical protein